MARTIKTRFTKGVFKPLVKVDIAEGKEFTLTVPEEPETEDF